MSQSPVDTMYPDPATMTIRKLVALDIVFHGPRFVLTELCLGVFGSLALGFVVAYPGFADGQFHFTQILVIGYLLCMAINYLPLALYGIEIARRGSAQEEVRFELAQRERYGRKYTAQSSLLLLPLVVPLMVLAQEWRKRARR